MRGEIPQFIGKPFMMIFPNGPIIFM